MDKILQALYNGEIYPAEQYFPKGKDYKDLRELHNQHYEKLVKRLGNPLDEEFEKFLDEECDVVSFEFSQMFADGFRLGARMMIDVYEKGE